MTTSVITKGWAQILIILAFWRTKNIYILKILALVLLGFKNKQPPIWIMAKLWTVFSQRAKCNKTEVAIESSFFNVGEERAVLTAES